MNIEILSLAIAGLVFIYLIHKISELKRDIKEKDVIMVDTSGIPINPPELFIDVHRNKTINFEIGKYKIKICQLPILMCLNYIERLSMLFKALKSELEYKPVSNLDKIRHNILYLNIYNSIVYLIYKLSRQFVNDRKGYKKELYKKGKDDIQFIINVCSEIFDYWVYVKKKLQFLTMGTTMRQQVGMSSLDCVKLDGDGKILIQPRYVPLSNISKN